MLAIHNNGVFNCPNVQVANAFAKLSKCQQFTTNSLYILYPTRLQTLLQSYQNVSNSQQCYIFLLNSKSCKRFCKVIKMLAIHNVLPKLGKTDGVANAFAKLSKCQQFTTVSPVAALSNTLQTLLQSYQNVSNSQLSCNSPIIKDSCKQIGRASCRERV